MLDEPTAFIDVDTNKMIYEILNELKKHSTIIIVTHSDSPLLLFDNVLNLDKCS